MKFRGYLRKRYRKISGTKIRLAVALVARAGGLLAARISPPTQTNQG
jgi:hypothetical protein